MKILVADDSRTGLAILTATLTKLGHEVMSATSGEEAIAIFMKIRPDFIILDVVMQQMNGFECAQKIREIDNQHWIPIIFLSASVDDDSISKGINAGGDDYLTKPFSDITLAAKIKAMQRIADMQKKLYETSLELSVLSKTDVLTGLNNRLQFDKMLKDEINYAKNHHIQLALLFLDLDRFKEINDHLGHHIGDELLKEVAKRLKHCLRSDDFLARLGGDEFAIILRYINHPEDVNLMAQKILDALKCVYQVGEHELYISGSIGISCYPQAGTIPEMLIQHADIAMYHAKELGRNNFQHYMLEFQPIHQQQFELEHALRVAVEKNELYMCYQPIFSLDPQQLVGMEALIRWQHPKWGLMQPDNFIPIAENIGLITQIGNWALETVCEQAAQWHRTYQKPFRVSINVSLKQLLHVEFLTLIEDILKKTQLPAHILDLELTESTIMTSSTFTEKIIKQLVNMGVNIILDDFGTGYSSLNHIKRLPISALKIDKSFIADIALHPNEGLIVQAIAALSNTLKLHLIAEGIETQEQLDFLIKHHCQYGQGFYLCKPLTANKMGLLLQDTNKTS